MFEGFISQRIKTAEATIFARVGGSGPPLLLLHGYPQTHVMWHRVAPQLAQRFTVVCTDLRGYGDSDKPPADSTHAAYGKRRMAADQVAVMQQLGFEQFRAVGHDRGGRVLHRLLLDYPQRVSRAALLDIVPTRHVFNTIDQQMATIYEHWFFLIQPDGFPEYLIGQDPDYYLSAKLRRWSARFEAFSPEAMAEYQRCFRQPETIHATCEDYRAAATIDLAHDEADQDQKIQCPLLLLWGQAGAMERCYDVLEVWRDRASQVQGYSIPGGHFLPEEAPAETLQALLAFFQ
ncbi:alpha/beta hydrolase [Romeria aff. gracilis LEGE 07310]|uniref:Alpha/beta hydrolase n=1 Tax=Vasconcelosia minhoensis LEGE 07310 TaxID=915328 RepID=A0A8J7A8L8_9CYAN|nr:alpha/beta hydrolase [Romeria gracilis]MBE9075986.1 alpha/beta hydrolase [Romeria aff. gracilis LEGE 07310]